MDQEKNWFLIKIRLIDFKSFHYLGSMRFWQGRQRTKSEQTNFVLLTVLQFLFKYSMLCVKYKERSEYDLHENDTLAFRLIPVETTVVLIHCFVHGR